MDVADVQQHQTLPRRTLCWLFLGALFVLCLVAIAQAAQPDKKDKDAKESNPLAKADQKVAKMKFDDEYLAHYQEDIKKNYSYRFGKNPWLPSQTQSENGDFIPAAAFPRAEYCAKCHEEAHRQWRESAHANAFRNP